MTGHREPTLDSLPPDVRDWVDDRAAAFDEAWRNGDRPAVAAFLADGPGRAALLRELVRTDVEYRVRAGELPAAADYRELFPDGDPNWLAAALAAAKQVRYQLVGEINSGGMGTVYRATDTVLGREVAVKVLQERFAAGSAEARRFAAESRITARLEHPAIPPVHDVGVLSDGRPFLAMKLVAGDTLAELLKRRQQLSDDRGRFVAVFEKVCEAVAFAHQKEILHRDLKPSNVMVGAFGEVQVMDWGLAKSGVPTAGRNGTDAADDDPERTTDHPPDDPTSDRTRPGQALGTPAYMPPEQARGKLGEIDARSDVFGLGGILGVILTGHPPYSGDTAEARGKASARLPPDVLERLGECGADPELVGLCARCLNPDPDRRPSSASEVALVVAKYRAGVDERLRAAERGRLRQGLYAALLALVAGLAFWGWWQQRQWGYRVAAKTRAVDEVLETARGLNDLGLSQSMDLKRWEETLRRASAAVGRAEELAAATDATNELRGRVRRVREQVRDAEADHRFGVGVEALLTDAFEQPGRRGHDATARALQQLLRERGFDLTAAGVPRLTEWVRGHRLKVSLQALLAFLAFWHPDQNAKQQLRTVLEDSSGGEAVKPIQWVAALGLASLPMFKASGREELVRLSADPVLEQLSPTALALVCRAMLRRGEREIVLLRLTAWRAVHPYSFWLNVQLADVLRAGDPPRRPEAVRYAQAAVDIRGDSARAHTTLASAYLANERVAEADAACRTALKCDPTYPPAVDLQAQIRARLP